MPISSQFQTIFYVFCLNLVVHCFSHVFLVLFFYAACRLTENAWSHKQTLCNSNSKTSFISTKNFDSFYSIFFRAVLRTFHSFHSLEFNDFLRGTWRRERIEKQLNNNIKFHMMCIGPEITRGKRQQKTYKNSKHTQKRVSFSFVEKFFFRFQHIWNHILDHNSNVCSKRDGTKRFVDEWIMRYVNQKQTVDIENYPTWIRSFCLKVLVWSNKNWITF